MEPISALVVEDSEVARELLCHALNSDPRIRVIAAVGSAEAALRQVPRLKPDVISMDVRLPGMNGIEATRRIMTEHPTPIVIVAADLSNETVNSSMEAMRAGALSVIEKPTVESSEHYRSMARRLCDHFVNMSGLKVVRQRSFGRAARNGTVAAPTMAEPPPTGRPVEVIGIAASTGGPPAVAALLQGLGPDVPVPILIVQHMGAAFLEGYADWLNSTCDIEVTLARNGIRPAARHVYVGPGEHHLTYAHGHLRLIPDDHDRGFVPSADVLFRSLAAAAAARGLGILLTGMGDDGAKGLLEMRRAGAFTIGQDRTTSAVYGMPAAAKAIGAVSEELPLNDMAQRVSGILSGPARRALPRPTDSDSRSGVPI